MILTKVALFILLIALTFYLSEKIMWIIYFLFNFRLWHLIMEKIDLGIYDRMGNTAQIFILIVLALATYLTIYGILMRPSLRPLKYIYLAGLMILVFSYYSLSELFFFQDYFNFGEVMSVENIKNGGFKISIDSIADLIIKIGRWVLGYIAAVIEWVEKVM